MDKLYEAKYEVCGEHCYLMHDRYRAETWGEALEQFAEEAGECYGGHEDGWFDFDAPFGPIEMYDGRLLSLISLERIPDPKKLIRACQFALRYIDSLPTPPMWMPDPTRKALREELARALA